MAQIAPSTFIAGPYTLTWNAVALGIMKGDEGAPTIEQLTHGQEVRGTTDYGDLHLETFELGRDFFAQFTCMEYRTGSIAVLAVGGTFGQQGIIGLNHTSLAKALVLTAAQGPPANPSGTGSPLTITATYSLLAPNFNTRLLYMPKLREVPLRLVLYPYTNTGTNVNFLQT